MAKTGNVFVCSECQNEESRWAGKCSACGEFNTMEESTRQAKPGQAAKKSARTHLKPESLGGKTAAPERISTRHSEFDRSLGGGLVTGSVVLIGGDPGVGKSTLLLQACAAMSPDRSVTYFSGEESLDQIQLRAERLGLSQAPVDLVASNDALAIADYLETLESGSVVVLDSIQVMNAGLDSVPGSPSQVKTAASHLITAAKGSSVTLIIVSHVTKDGTLAGPQILMHHVDATAYIESDMSAGLFRLLRMEKNRFGSIGEVGVFEMTDRGMTDVTNPSEVFISQMDRDAFGTVIYTSVEGTRPLLLEIQALVAPTAFGTGRRTAIGWDSGRLNMLLATLAARLGLSMPDYDIYINVAGGMKVTDPAMDLAVATAILSAYAQEPMPPDFAVFGEIGLAGEVRNASRAEARLREAEQMGIQSVLGPSQSVATRNLKPITRVSEIFSHLPNLSAVYGSDRAA